MSDSLHGLSLLPFFGALPNWQNQPQKDRDIGRDVLRYNLGYASIRNRTSFNGRKLAYSFFPTSKEEEFALLDFFHTQGGRHKRFWLPIHYSELILASDIAIGDIACTVVDNPFPSGMVNERIYIETSCGDQISAKVVDSTGNTLEIAGYFDRDIAIADIRIFGLVVLVRFDHDDIITTFTTDTLSDCKLSFKELPSEYVEILDIPDADFVWEYHDPPVADFTYVVGDP